MCRLDPARRGHRHRRRHLWLKFHGSASQLLRLRCGPRVTPSGSDAGNQNAQGREHRQFNLAHSTWRQPPELFRIIPALRHGRDLLALRHAGVRQARLAALELHMPGHRAGTGRAWNNDHVVRQTVANFRRENDGRPSLVQGDPVERAPLQREDRRSERRRALSDCFARRWVQIGSRLLKPILNRSATRRPTPQSLTMNLGGRCRIRTCDPCRVKAVLYR